MGFLDEILGKEALRKLQNDLAQSAEALSMAKSELHSLRVEKHTVDEGLAASIANARVLNTLIEEPEADSGT